MTLKKHYLITFFLIGKLLIDFFVPIRGLNFLVTIIAATFLANWYPLKKSTLYQHYSKILFFLATFIILLINHSDLDRYLKLFSCAGLFFIFYNVGYQTNSFALRNSFSIYWNLLLIAFFINYAISIQIGLLSKRMFWNFEHVTLLGSYLTTAGIPLIFLENKSPSQFRKIFFVLLAFLTTSTGAFIASLFIFLQPKSFNVKIVFRILLVLMLSTTLISYLIFTLDKELAQKVFSPILLFSNKLSFSSFVDFAIRGKPLIELGPQYQSSFLWRIYAYILCFNFYLNQTLTGILFGNGLGGYVAIEQGMMPHNDFILILIDFGTLFFIVFLFYLIRKCFEIVKRHPAYLGIYIMIMLALLFENNIYSFYLLSNFSVLIGLVSGNYIAAKNNPPYESIVHNQYVSHPKRSLLWYICQRAN